MEDFLYTKENAPTYLRDTYGIETLGNGGINLNRLIWDDFEFVDSKSSSGVQLADLLASGMRRCLKGDFTHNDEISSALGKLMVQHIKGEFPLRLITLIEKEQFADGLANRVSHFLKKNQKLMVL